MKTKHTKTPWQVNHFDRTQICDTDGETRGCAPIAYTSGSYSEKVQNAKFIVTACNAHHDLVAAAEHALQFLALSFQSDSELAHQLLDAITLAKGNK